jgi:MoxR-like ATPase
MAEELTAAVKYSGTHQPAEGAQDGKGRPLRPYLPPEELVEAVNLALFLGRPLLLRGEPGCGKSQLASAVAFELAMPLEIWNIRSTTRAVDGLYVYDAVGRLQAAQLAALEQQIGGVPVDAGRFAAQGFIRLGPVGRAFDSPRQAVLLIDEIDKADIDFPNDILDIIEHPTFDIEETGARVEAKHPPLIIITSNDEKELPDAFLRRCLFAYVPFPDPPRLRQIIEAHFAEALGSLAHKAIQRFIELRARQERDSYGGVKKASTSELIDWLRALLEHPDDALEALEDGKPYPYRSLLIKRKEDSPFADIQGDLLPNRDS